MTRELTAGSVVGGCAAAAVWGPRRLRALSLALACGVDFGVNAFLLKVVPDMLPAGFSDPLSQWPCYLILVVIPVGFLLNQDAFQAGTLLSPALAVSTTVDPLAWGRNLCIGLIADPAIAPDVTVLAERIRAHPGASQQLLRRCPAALNGP